jgi:hypothetical protein
MAPPPPRRRIIMPIIWWRVGRVGQAMAHLRYGFSFEFWDQCAPPEWYGGADTTSLGWLMALQLNLYGDPTLSYAHADIPADDDDDDNDNDERQRDNDDLADDDSQGDDDTIPLDDDDDDDDDDSGCGCLKLILRHSSFPRTCRKQYGFTPIEPMAA